MGDACVANIFQMTAQLTNRLPVCCVTFGQMRFAALMSSNLTKLTATLATRPVECA